MVKVIFSEAGLGKISNFTSFVFSSIPTPPPLVVLRILPLLPTVKPVFALIKNMEFRLSYVPDIPVF